MFSFDYPKVLWFLSFLWVMAVNGLFNGKGCQSLINFYWCRML